MKKLAIMMAGLLFIMTGCAGNVKDGVEYLEAKEYTEAITAFEKDVAKEKNLDEAYRGMGIAYFELEDYEAAVEAFEAALENEAEETAVICGLMGACYMQLESYENAREIYEKALTKEDITAELKQEIRFNLIAVYEFTGDWETAKTHMEQYVKDYPDDSRVDKEAKFLETR